jgi:hypothetical protein
MDLQDYYNVINGGSKNSGYIKLLLAKHLYKKKANDYEGAPYDKYRPDRKMAKKFNINAMQILNNPPDSFNSPSAFIKKAYGKKQKKSGSGSFSAIGSGSFSAIGSGAKPPEKTFYDVVKEGYKVEASPSVDNMDRILNTPTVKAYIDRNAKTIIIVSRGTEPKDTKDLKADAMIIVNNLKNSDRYNTDKNIVANLATEYPPETYDYYMTGHSLGGAITAQLKREFPFIKDAVLYNPASQPYDIVNQQSDQIKRLYTEDDPLYAMGGKFITNKQVIPTNNKTIDTQNSSGITKIIKKGYNFYQGHALDNFNKLYGGYFHRKGDGTGSRLRGGINN